MQITQLLLLLEGYKFIDSKVGVFVTNQARVTVGSCTGASPDGLFLPLAYGGGTVPWAPPSDPKNKKNYKQYSAVYTKMFNCRRITLFCLVKRLSKHKMTIFSKILGGGMAPLASPQKFSAYITDSYIHVVGNNYRL